MYNISSVVNKSTQLLDLEKYFKQQAALSAQKRNLKKSSKPPCNKDRLVLSKTTKCNTDIRTSKRPHKAKDNINVKDDSLKIIKEKDLDIPNKIADDDNSGSEYIPSDDEVDSGNIDI